MSKFTPLALGFLTLLSTAATARCAIASTSLQSAKPSAELHAQVIMKGGSQPEQRQPEQRQPEQRQPEQRQSEQRQPEQRREQPEQRQTERREQPERPPQGGLFRERGPERRRPENFPRRPHRPHEGRGQWHRERRHGF
jgi:transcription initiation factor TFIID subunit TAF12